MKLCDCCACGGVTLQSPKVRESRDGFMGLGVML